jgi:hypothetical protein
MRNEILRCAKRHVLAIDYRERHPRPRGSVSLYKECVHHPEPKPIYLNRTLSRKPDSQDADLFDRRDVLQRVAIEALSSRSRREGRPTFAEVGLLCVYRNAFAFHQLATLDLGSP